MELPQGSDADVLTAHITTFCGYAKLLSDQVRRRLPEEEKIPHDEKIYSVFEPHTRWTSKGKKGCSVELGVPVCVNEDQHRFIVDRDIMWKGGDRDVIFGAVDRVASAFGSIEPLSLDKGFWSPAVFAGLQEIWLSFRRWVVATGRRRRESRTRHLARAAEDILRSSQRLTNWSRTVCPASTPTVRMALP